ncbi:MAG: ornithine cyclodeaminase family protein [Chthonomonadales bacterium]
MSTLFITESEVSRLISAADCVDALDHIFQSEVPGNYANHSRRRFLTPKGTFHFMEAYHLGLGRAAMKVYASFRPATRFLVLLWDTESGDLLAQIEADKLGQLRTGAASGIATKYMSNPDAANLCVFGAGWQAESQILAIAAVRKLKRIMVYSRTEEKRTVFANRMHELTGIQTISAESPEQALDGAEIIVTATSSATPLFDGKLVQAGAHINAVGANMLNRAEIDRNLVGRCGKIVVDSIEQAKLEAGDLQQAVDGRRFRWEQAIELSDVVSGRFPGRSNAEEITLFKSNGIALEDLAAASLVYDRAIANGLGRPIELWQG